MTTSHDFVDQDGDKLEIEPSQFYPGHLFFKAENKNQSRDIQVRIDPDQLVQLYDAIGVFIATGKLPLKLKEPHGYIIRDRDGDTMSAEIFGGIIRIDPVENEDDGDPLGSYSKEYTKAQALDLAKKLTTLANQLEK